MSEEITIKRYASGVAEDTFSVDQDTGELSHEDSVGFKPSENAYPLWEVHIPKLNKSYELECDKHDLIEIVQEMVNEEPEVQSGDVEIDLGVSQGEA